MSPLRLTAFTHQICSDWLWSHCAAFSLSVWMDKSLHHTYLGHSLRISVAHRHSFKKHKHNNIQCKSFIESILHKCTQIFFFFFYICSDDWLLLPLTCISILHQFAWKWLFCLLEHMGWKMYSRLQFCAYIQFVTWMKTSIFMSISTSRTDFCVDWFVKLNIVALKRVSPILRIY